MTFSEVKVIRDHEVKLPILVICWRRNTCLWVSFSSKHKNDRRISHVAWEWKQNEYVKLHGRTSKYHEKIHFAPLKCSKNDVFEGFEVYLILAA